MLECKAPELSLRNIDVLVHVAEFSGRQWDRWPRRAEGSKVAVRYGCIGNVKHTKVWNVFNGIECDVAKVPFIANPKPSTHTRFAVAKDIVGKSDARRNCTPSWRPKCSYRALRGYVHLT